MRINAAAIVIAVVYAAGVIGVFGTVDPLPRPVRALAALAWPALVVGCAVVAISDAVHEL